MGSEETNSVSLKLPTFWDNRPAIWFKQAEAQFILRGITVSATKYYHCIAALDQHTAIKISNFIETHEDNSYDALKQQLLSTFGITKRQRAHAIFDMKLGDDKPSEMMERMLSLMESEKPGLLFEHLFLERMPASVRLALAQEDFKNPREVAKKADILLATMQESAGSNDLPRTSTICAATKDDGVCFFHARFGEKARKCVKPCKYTSKNEQPNQK